MVKLQAGIGAEMKVHLAIISVKRDDIAVHMTLCGRMHSKMDCDADNNLTDERGKVTCRNCEKIIANPKHWRHRRFLNP